MAQPEVYKGSSIRKNGSAQISSINSDMEFSNINPLITEVEAEKLWDECKMGGCHGPSYRKFRKTSTKNEWIDSIAELSPFVAGVVDGVHAKTIGKATTIAKGVKRTADGLHVNGRDDFERIGEESYAAYLFATSTYKQILELAEQLSAIENPIAQMVMAVVTEYINILPEEMLDHMFRSGAFVFQEALDPLWLTKAANMGITGGVPLSPEDIQKLGEIVRPSVDGLVGSRSQQFIGKQLGKKLAGKLGYAIASLITKQILKNSGESFRTQKTLAQIRQKIRANSKGLPKHLGTAMLAGLTMQGSIEKVSEASERLKVASPQLWRLLRYKLNGANMAYFLIEDMVSEYVDRISLLQKNPEHFMKIMAALVRDGATDQIFFAGVNIQKNRK